MPRILTAIGVAALRAAQAQEHDPLVRNPDYIAVSLLPVPLRIVARLRPVVWLAVKYCQRILPGGYYFHIARTKHIDSVLQQCTKEGIQQLVILGAGLDSRANRFQEILNGVTVFEVDLPGIQTVKRERLSKLFGQPPQNVIYVPIDLNVQGLSILFEHGYSDRLTTLFIWEGVCMYLKPEAVDKVLSFVREHSPPGSSIVFDYIFQSMIEGAYRHFGAKQSAHYAAKVGEPYLFGIEEGKVEEFLRNRGFHIISEYTPAMLERAYLLRKDGQISGRVYGYTNIVHAATR